MFIWKTFFYIYLVFLAELGDKRSLHYASSRHNESYLCILSITCSYFKRYHGVYLGTIISKSLPLDYIHLGGIAFIIIGILLITQKFKFIVTIFKRLEHLIHLKLFLSYQSAQGIFYKYVFYIQRHF